MPKTSARSCRLRWCERFCAASTPAGRRDVPGLGVITQNLENPTLRARLGMPAGRSGVLVSRVEFGGACWGAIEAGDALLSIAGMPIANNGTIQYRGPIPNAI